MHNRTTPAARQEQLLSEMTQRMLTLTQQLCEWVQAEEPTLAEMEQQLIGSIKELANALLSGICALLPPRYPAAELPCACGGQARYQRDRPAQVHTLLGPLQLLRPYYYCASCQHGLAPLDLQLQVCAGSISAGLEELLALLGAREDSFETAASVLEKLTLLRLCPNSVRAATERLGSLIAADEQQELQQALETLEPAPLPGQAAQASSDPFVYVSMDGVLVHTHEGWKECKLGAVYTTRTLVPRQRPEQLQVRTVAPSFVTDFAAPEHFGPLLWQEARRRGVSSASNLVAIGDGAHWIWNLVEAQFPGAVQIVDWYHASQYIWQVAQAVYGEGSELANQWAKSQLDSLWEGKAAAVLEAFSAHAQRGEAVQAAISYYSNNLERMHYERYRAQGMQIGSGTIESGCKHVIGARLKQAGMIWDVEGARTVAKVRARLKSGRWEETIARRPPLRRTYTRSQLAA